MTPATNDQNPRSPESELTSTLARQAERYSTRGGTGLQLEQVVSRAGEIQRGRRMRATMVMAAVVLAIAVPVGITSLSSDATKAPVTPAATAPPATVPDDSPVGLGDLKTGDEPADGYAFDHVLHHGSSTIDLDPSWVVADVARIDGGFMVAHYTNENGGITNSFVADGQDGTDTTWESENAGFATSPGGNVAAFVDHTNTVIAVQDGGSRYFELGQVPASIASTATAVAGENCSGRSEEVGCTVYVEVSYEGGSPSTQTWAFSPNVAPKQVFDGLTHVIGATPDGRVGGMVSFSDEGSCWEVRSPDNQRLWKTCKNSLDEFSPDGKYVVAGPAYRDGPGGGGLTILDASNGKVVLDLKTQDNSFINGARWEGNTHVIASVYDTGKFAVERFALDGSREYATQTERDADDSYVSPFDLG